jgi:drug/metabolite transporter (DMT)-like permease
MNKLEANISLIIITFFAAIQYAFLSGVPDTVSHFSFLCITNLIGLAITLALFFSELFRVDKKQVFQSLTMSCLLFGFNIFLLLGTSGVGATVSACVLSAYFIFIPLFAFLLYRQKPVLMQIKRA